MIYATTADLHERFGQYEIEQLADRNNTEDPATIAAVVEKALADADGEIDGYLTGIYSLPLPTIPKLLNSIAVDVARWHLAGTRITEDVEKRYKLAKKTLEQINQGKVRLGVSEDTNDSPAFRAPPRVFNFSGGR